MEVEGRGKLNSSSPHARPTPTHHTRAPSPHALMPISGGHRRVLDGDPFSLDVCSMLMMPFVSCAVSAHNQRGEASLPLPLLIPFFSYLLRQQSVVVVLAKKMAKKKRVSSFPLLPCQRRAPSPPPPQTKDGGRENLPPILLVPSPFLPIPLRKPIHLPHTLTHYSTSPPSLPSH